MLHDAALGRSGSQTHEERRQCLRVELRDELILQWHHDPEAMVRYRLIDLSDSGCRIHSSLPLLAGMTGVALRLLPEGRPLCRTAMVAWSEPAGAGLGFEVGISFVEAA